MSHGQDLVGADEAEGELGVALVGLDAVGQPHGVEDGLVAGCAGALDGELAEPSGGGGVDAAADAEDQGAQTGGGEALGEEGHPALDLRARVEGLADLELTGDPLLQGGGLRVGHGMLLGRAWCTWRPRPTLCAPPDACRPPGPRAPGRHGGAGRAGRPVRVRRDGRGGRAGRGRGGTGWGRGGQDGPDGQGRRTFRRRPR
ncbi:hypothetical protein GCM10019017_09130 [Streptomyces showdoensis]